MNTNNKRGFAYMSHVAKNFHCNKEYSQRDIPGVINRHLDLAKTLKTDWVLVTNMPEFVVEFAKWATKHAPAGSYIVERSFGLHGWTTVTMALHGDGSAQDIRERLEREARLFADEADVLVRKAY
jgi:hypothetical protein